MIKILFVCTGNICRSAMAHYYMQKRVKDLKIEDKYLIDSAGLHAMTSQRATTSAIISMSDYGVNMNLHKATNIYDIDINFYDIILTMTLNHKRDIFIHYTSKSIREKVYTLKEFVDSNCEYKDIDDPWGFDMLTYKECAEEIVESVDKLIEKLEGCE